MKFAPMIKNMTRKRTVFNFNIFHGNFLAVIISQNRKLVWYRDYPNEVGLYPVAKVNDIAKNIGSN